MPVSDEREVDIKFGGTAFYLLLFIAIGSCSLPNHGLTNKQAATLDRIADALDRAHPKVEGGK